MNVIFMGTPDFSVPTLEKLIAQENVNISLVITQPDRKSGRGRKINKSPVKIIAEKNNIKVFQPEDINNKSSLDFIKSFEVDYIIVVAYGQILSKTILEHPKKYCINVHASILPKYRGASPINMAIMEGDKETGVTTMIMEEGLDKGDILKIKKFIIEPEMNAGELHDELMEVGGDLLIETILEIEKGNITPIKQDDSIATYAPMLNKDIGHINWNDNALEIHNKIRGLYPWPGSYTYYNGEKMKVIRTEYKNLNKSTKVGEIVEVSEKGIEVQSGDGTIIIKELQMPGKRKMNVKDYLLGNEIIKSKILK